MAGQRGLSLHPLLCDVYSKHVCSPTHMILFKLSGHSFLKINRLTIHFKRVKNQAFSLKAVASPLNYSSFEEPKLGNGEVLREDVFVFVWWL